MKNLLGLFEAICDTYDRVDFLSAADGTTHCNQACAAVAELLGCKDLTDRTADGIVEHLAVNPGWSAVSMEEAQERANEGSLVIAGLDSKALNQSHGHVVVIRPGIVCYSGKWGKTARCMNFGQEVFLGRAKKGPLTQMPAGVNEAFVPLPTFWVWKASL